MDLKEVLTRGVEEILPERVGLENLLGKKKIRLYLGIDPTGARLHLGHTIPLRKLQQFADLGHEAILLVGTGTVLAGDPSARQEARPQITEKEIEKNIATWREQAGKIIDFKKVKIRYNGDWLLKLTLKDILKIASQISAIQLFKREMFKQRIAQGDTVWAHETLYPLLQGYDSVALDVDLEIGGTDQTFNMLIGRELARKMANREKYVLTVPMIMGIDGRPMSKTSGNCVWLTEGPTEMFGKLMSIPDDQIISYFTLLTEVSEEEITEMEELLKNQTENPMVLKKKLAREVVIMYHSAEEAQKAQEEFEKVFQRKQLPTFTPTTPKKMLRGTYTLVQLVYYSGSASSKAQAKRLVEQGGVELNGRRILNPQFKVVLEGGELLKIGKKKFFKIDAN